MSVRTNNNGFAITTILYGMLIIFMFLLVSALSILSVTLRNKQLLVDGDNGTSARNVSKMKPIKEYASLEQLKSAASNDESLAINGLYCFSTENICRYVSRKEILGIEDTVYYTKSYDSKTKDHSFTVNYTGYYYIKACGAAGGDAADSNKVYAKGGKGACYEGYVKLNAGDNLFMNIGTRGESNNENGEALAGINGGGYGGVNKHIAAGGGGATDIRFGYDYYDSEYAEIRYEISGNKITYKDPDIPLAPGHYQIDIYGERLDKCQYGNLGSNNRLYQSVDKTHFVFYLYNSKTNNSFIINAYQNDYVKAAAKCNITRETISRVDERIFVMAGGGGATYNTDNDYGRGGSGGILIGNTGEKIKSGTAGTGGNQNNGAYTDTRLFSGGGSTSGGGGGGGYFGGKASGVYSGGGGGSSFVSGYAGMNANNKTTETRAKVNNNRYAFAKDDLLIVVGNKYYYKKNDGAAIYGYYSYYRNKSYYTGPVLVGTTPESVAFYRSDDAACGNVTSAGTITYAGVTYYYSGESCFIKGNYNDGSGLPNLTKLSSTSLLEAAKEIITGYNHSSTLHPTNKYFINSNIIPDRNNGDGYINISYIGAEEPQRTGILNNVRYVRNCIDNYYETDASTGNRTYKPENKEWIEFQIIKNGVNIVEQNKLKLYTNVPNANDMAATTAVDGKVANGVAYNPSEVYASPVKKKIHEPHCITYDIGGVTNVDEIAIWHNYGKKGVYEYNRLFLSSDNINWKEINFDNQLENDNGIRVNAWKNIKNIEESHYVKVTYDYDIERVDKRVEVGEYFDTDYVVNWDYDFEIETTINIPKTPASTTEEYIIFSSMADNTKVPFLKASINNSNQIVILINNTESKRSDKNSIHINEDIKIIFKWDSLHDMWTMSAKGNETNINLSDKRHLNESIDQSLRFGNSDYRTKTETRFKYPIIVKEFKISTMYLSGGELVNKPEKVMHYTKSETKEASGMIADDTYLLENVKVAPDKDMTYKVNWGEKIELKSITFDYNINRELHRTEYYDTDYNLNWDNDFTIEMTFKIPQLGKNYLLFSSRLNNKTNPHLFVGINTYNQIVMGVNGSQSNITVKNSIYANEDIKLVFHWDSLHMEYTIKATGTQTKIETKPTFVYVLGRNIDSIRLGNLDHQSDAATTYIYPIHIKEFKITSLNASTLKFISKPINIVRYENNANVPLLGMYDSKGNNLANIDKVPTEDTTYTANWAKGYETVNITYDYNVDNQISRNEYYDTGYTLSWDNDFDIETTVNIPQLGKNYLILSDWDGTNNTPYMYMIIENDNYLKLKINGTNNNLNDKNIKLRTNEDINIKLHWDSFNTQMTYTYKIGNDAEITKTFPVTINQNTTGLSKNKLRFGGADHRAALPNTYLYPIKFKLFKLTTPYIKGGAFDGKPNDIVRYENNVNISLIGMYDKDGNSLSNISKVPNTDTTYTAKWAKGYETVNITYDYNVDNQISRNEYYDTGTTINWDNDFDIETTVNIPTLKANYLILSDLADKSPTPYMYMTIDTNNILKLNINGAVNNLNDAKNIKLRTNEDINIKLHWDSFNTQMTCTYKIGNDAEITKTFPVTLTINTTGLAKNKLRFGSVDYRGASPNTYFYPIKFKLFKLTTPYIKSGAFDGKPNDVVRYENNASVPLLGMYDNTGNNLASLVNVPTVDTTYMARWSKGYETVNITYDYNVNDQISRNEYYDTGTTLNWDNDFDIETTINIPQLGKNYLILSDWNGTNNTPYMYMIIDTNNILKLNINGTNNNLNDKNIKLRTNEDINIKLHWDSFNTQMTCIYKIGNDAEITKAFPVTINQNMTGLAKNKLCFGSVDYRTASPNTYLYPIKFKLFKLTTPYIKGGAFDGKPSDVTHYVRNELISTAEIYNGNTNLKNVSQVPDTNTTYTARWNTDYSQVNVTYDYEVNKTYNSKEYLDTGYLIDWDRNFKIETTINVPELKANYLIFSSYNGTKPTIMAVIETDNRLHIYINGSRIIHSQNNYVSANEDIKVIFEWDSFNSIYKLTARGNNTNISLTGVQALAVGTALGISEATLRIGLADHRGSPQNSFKQPITIKEFKITETMLKGYQLPNQPVATEGGYIIRNWKKQDDSILNNGEIINDNVTYHTNWIANTYTLTLDGNYGLLPETEGYTNASNNKTATKTITFNSPYGLLATPYRNGYNFAGWYTAASGGTLIDSNTIVTTVGDHKLYAHWTR